MESTETPCGLYRDFVVFCSREFTGLHVDFVVFYYVEFTGVSVDSMWTLYGLCNFLY